MLYPNIVIDDERSFPNLLAVYYRTSAEALYHLNHIALEELNTVEALWLDHDLGGDDTTMPVVDYLCELAYSGNPYPVVDIFVHTQNPVGGNTILRSLQRYGYSARRVPLPN